MIRTGIAELYPEISDEMLTASAVDADHLDIRRSLGLSSAMIVPLSAGRQIFGVMTFVSATPAHRYDTGELDFALELAGRASLAVENARLYQEAQSANRLKDEFLATLSHELRTPLNVILGRSRMIDRATTLDAARQLSEAIARNAVTLAKLVDDLLDVSRITVGQIKLERQLVSLASVVEAAVQAVQPAIEAKRLVLTLDAPPSLPLAHGDPMRLQQVVWNLLTNAAKFTPPGGTISVSLALDGGDFLLLVRDTGEGISPDALPRVFDLFWQVEASSSRRHGGLGLGVSLVKKLVELHGGEVRAESDGIGRGTTMSVRLPVQPAAAAASDVVSGRLQSIG